jgi:hypothetical protein
MSQIKKYRKTVLLLLVLFVMSGYGIYSYWENKKPGEETFLDTSATKTEIDMAKISTQAESTDLPLVEMPQTTTTDMLSLAAQSQQTAQLKQQTVGEQPQRHIQLAQHDAAEIGLKIWQNESGGKIAGLTSWNQRENFASLGIGHFIWYSPGQEGPFTETFPDLLNFLQEQGVILPDWLQETRDCPWNSRAEFQNAQQSPKMKSLRQLLKETISEQTQFIIRRLESALPKILAALPTEMQRAPIRKQFYRVGQTAKGVYALIDYVHFKGEGISPTERYQGQGWGLLQVLEQMLAEPTTGNATEDFAEAALWVLKRRIKNSPPERREDRWLFGWISRLNTYR